MNRDQTVQRNIWILLGVTIFLLVVMATAWGLALNKPLLEKIARKKVDLEGQNTQAAKLPDALKAKAQAEEKQQYVKAQLYFFQNRYRHLVFDYGDPKDAKEPQEIKDAKRRQTWQRWLDEYYLDYGIALKKELYRVANAAGVTITTAIKVSPPPKVPEEMPEKPAGFLKPIADNNGSLAVTVIGDYTSIMNFFAVINTSDILMLVGNVRLEGSSPSIKATFPVTPYLVETGDPVAAQGAAPPPPPAAAPRPAAAPAASDSSSSDEVDTSVKRPHFGGSKGDSGG